jgi:hypothetical protein
MNGIAVTLSEVSRILKDLNLHFALIGGLAVSVRTEPRFTRDIDLAVAVSGDPQSEQVLHQLQNRGYLIKAIVEQEAAHRLATSRLQPPGQHPEGLIVDQSAIKGRIPATRKVFLSMAKQRTRNMV